MSRGGSEERWNENSYLVCEQKFALFYFTKTFVFAKIRHFSRKRQFSKDFREIVDENPNIFTIMFMKFFWIPPKYYSRIKTISFVDKISLFLNKHRIGICFWFRLTSTGWPAQAVLFLLSCSGYPFPAPVLVILPRLASPACLRPVV